MACRRRRDVATPSAPVLPRRIAPPTITRGPRARYPRAVDGSDAELLDAWQAGDHAAGDRLFARHFDTVFGFFQRRMAGDVSDLVQRTFLGLVEARGRVRGESSVRTYLFVIARRELWAHYEKQKRQGALDFGVSSIEDLTPSPSSMLRHKDDHALLGEALRRIPVDLQLVVELHYWEGLAGPEIAKIIDVPEGTVRSRLRRALEALRLKLEEVAGASRAEWGDADRLEVWAAAMAPRVSAVATDSSG